VAENRRLLNGKVVQRQVLYLGEINDSQRAAWRKTIEVCDEGAKRQVALFPEDVSAFHSYPSPDGCPGRSEPMPLSCARISWVYLDRAASALRSHGHEWMTRCCNTYPPGLGAHQLDRRLSLAHAYTWIREIPPVAAHSSIKIRINLAIIKKPENGRTGFGFRVSTYKGGITYPTAI
jgi:hypothetical protein